MDRTLIDEDFSPEVILERWQDPAYDDRNWVVTGLPVVHGGERHAAEDLYLRSWFSVRDFGRAELNIEWLDPGGEIWINGQIVSVIKNRYPVKEEIGKFLLRDSPNLIAIRIPARKMEDPMFHAPADPHIGWSMGRAWLDLTPDIYLEDVFPYTLRVGDAALTRQEIRVRNGRREPFQGSLTVSYYPWFPSEADTPAATLSVPVAVRAWSDELVQCDIDVANPSLWAWNSPNLYKVEVTLADSAGTLIDDQVLTTGIRTVSQQGGTFRINGEAEMLNGAQIMGYRIPIENLSLWNRCPPAEVLAEEVLMIKKMKGNLLRVHVHSTEDLPDGINDPRLAEMCDQLGIMLIWQTAAFIREGEAWGVDFEGLPHYIRQVRQHPSIVIWEVSNHPNRFKLYELDYSNDFFDVVYQTVFPFDSSRLISATSALTHTHFGNDAGTIDYQDRPINATPSYTAPMVTRGNQDSVTGYGKKWDQLRNWPPDYQQDFLDSPERAYFNFEHEESIGQPNWSLCRGKPWYLLQSYEWRYDEGSIGRKLSAEEWRESQAWQAFSAYESMRKQRLLGYDGFSWCCLHGGPNMATYKKPLIDALGHAKLSFYANRMAFQRVLAGSDNVDVVYGPDDEIVPVVMNLGRAKRGRLEIVAKDLDGRVVDQKVYPDVRVDPGRSVTRLDPFKSALESSGYYMFEYVFTLLGGE